MHWCTNKAGETQRPVTRYHILRLGYWCKQCCGWTCGNTLNILYLSEFAPWRNLSDLFNILYSMLNWCLELIVVFSTVSLRHHTQKKKKQQHLSTNYFGVQLLYCGKLGHDVFVCPNEFIWYQVCLESRRSGNSIATQPKICLQKYLHLFKIYIAETLWFKGNRKELYVFGQPKHKILFLKRNAQITYCTHST